MYIFVLSVAWNWQGCGFIFTIVLVCIFWKITNYSPAIPSNKTGIEALNVFLIWALTFHITSDIKCFSRDFIFSCGWQLFIFFRIILTFIIWEHKNIKLYLGGFSKLAELSVSGWVWGPWSLWLLHITAQCCEECGDCYSSRLNSVSGEWKHSAEGTNITGRRSHL